MAENGQSQRSRVKTGRKKQATTQKALCVPVAQFLTDILSMRKGFSIVSLKKGQNSTFSTIDMCLGIVAIIMLECHRLFHINTEYQQERLLAHQLGLKRIFEQSTAHRFINRFKGWHINQLERLNYKLLKEHGESFKDPVRILDIDATTHSVQGRKRQGATPGKNSQQRGNDCYQESAVFCNGELVTQKLDKGHVHCKKRFDTVYQKAKKVFQTIDYLRLDSGYFALDVLKALLALPGLLFVLCSTPNCIGMKQAMAIAIQQPWRFKRVGGTKDVYAMEFKQLPILKQLKTPLRLVLIKTLRKPKKVKKGYVFYQRGWYYYGLVSNIEKSKMHSRKLYKFYQRRVVIEHFFKETKQSFHASKLPSMKLGGNEAYLWFVSLAYNASIWFKRDLMPKKEQKCMFKTIRRKLCVNADYRIVEQNILELEFDQEYQYKRLFDTILTRIERVKTAMNTDAA